MRAHQKEFTLERMAKILRVLRSGFYVLRRPKIYQEIDRVILDIFTQHKGRDGSFRIHAELKKQGIFCSRYAIEIGMKALKLYAGKKKQRPKATFALKGGKDRLNRHFNGEKPNEKWYADISAIPIRGFFAYLSVILDLYARKVVGWTLNIGNKVWY